MLAVAKDNMDLTAYLVKEVPRRHGDKVEALREYYPEAQDGDWELITAGQRVQIIKKDPKKGGVLQFGTEVIAGRRRHHRRPAGRLPGRVHRRADHDRTAPEAASRKQFKGWQSKLKEMMPGYGVKLNENPELAAELEAEHRQDAAAGTGRRRALTPGPGCGGPRPCSQIPLKYVRRPTRRP